MRWTRPAGWHLTLLFLGSVRPERVPELVGLLDGLAVELEPYAVVVRGGGGRAGRGEGVAWLRVEHGAGTLIETARTLARRCPPDITDGTAPRRTPSAHLTVARTAGEPVVSALAQQAHGPLAVRWTISHLDLVRSHLEGGGARYETLHRAPL